MAQILSSIRLLLVLPALPTVLLTQEVQAHQPFDSHNSKGDSGAELVIEQPIGNVRIGYDLVGERRYTNRSMPSDGIFVVELSKTPEALVSLSNATPPELETLAGRPDLQEAYDANARPGQFVTPPAISM